MSHKKQCLQALEKGKVLLYTENVLMEVDPEKLVKQSVDGLLHALNRDEAKTLQMMEHSDVMPKKRLVNDLAVAKVIRALYREAHITRELSGMNAEELQKLLDKRMDEIWSIRQALDKKRGDVPKGRAVEFCDYVTD